jgi:hypothetical protein
MIGRITVGAASSSPARYVTVARIGWKYFRNAE